MKNFRILMITGLSVFVAISGACASDPAAPGTTATANTDKSVNTANTVTANPANSSSHESSTDDTPASVKAIFTDAQSFMTQHKDVSDSAIASIEKDTGGKVPDKDHHSYLAFAAKDGKRTQIGAATVVKADGKDVIIVYESKDGMPTVREVRAEGIPAGFLKQFVGKNHDSKIKFGEDIKALGGVSEEQAKAIAQAVRIDVLTMEALYGSAHSH